VPYQVRKTSIIEKIVDVVKDGRITGISDVRDESDRDGIRLVIELKKGEDPQVIVNQLYQYTPMQATQSIINLVIDRGQPRTLPLRGLLDSYLTHRKDVIRRRTQFLLTKAEERKHIVEGLRTAVDNIDRVIQIVRGSKDTDEAKASLQAEFQLSARQAQAIVDMRLGRLTGLEREKLEEEFAKLVAEIADLKDILDREARVVEIIRADLDDMEKSYGDARRTEISDEEIDGNFDIEELITEEMMVVTFSNAGYVKRVPLDVYRAQGRGGRGIRGSDAKEGDVLSSLFVAGTHDHLLCFSNRGQIYWLKVYQLPESSRTSPGRAIANLIGLHDGEKITNVLRVPEFDDESFVVFATRGGKVKKTALHAYSRPKKGGIRAILLEEGDEVVGVGLCAPGDTVVLASAHGQSARFDESAARAMGRTSYGVRGIKLREGDRVVAMVVVKTEDASLLTACENGYGKRTPIADYPIKGRGGLGVINIRAGGRNGEVVGMRRCHDDDDVMYITEGGMIVRSPVNETRPMGRNVQGMRLVNLKQGDRLVGVEIVTRRDLEAYGLSEDDGQPAEGAVPEAGAEPEVPKTPPIEDAPPEPAE
jgi:DNA gyrase subunit A